MEVEARNTSTTMVVSKAVDNEDGPGGRLHVTGYIECQTSTEIDRDAGMRNAFSIHVKVPLPRWQSILHGRKNQEEKQEQAGPGKVSGTMKPNMDGPSVYNFFHWHLQPRKPR